MFFHCVTPTSIYMSGSCRSWIHYITLRSANGTQKEHMQVAEACKKVFIEQFPTVAEAMGWSKYNTLCECYANLSCKKHEDWRDERTLHDHETIL